MKQADLQALSDAASDGPWVIERGAIVPVIRERPGGPQVGTAILDEDAAYIVALVNAHRVTLRAATPVVPAEGLRERIETALRKAQDEWNRTFGSHPGDAFRTLEREVRAALAASPSPDTDREPEPGETRFDPWFEVECTQLCGWKATTPTEAEAREHAATTGHETYLARHESAHYRRPE